VLASDRFTPSIPDSRGLQRWKAHTDHALLRISGLCARSDPRDGADRARGMGPGQDALASVGGVKVLDDALYIGTQARGILDRCRKIIDIFSLATQCKTLDAAALYP
jgi:hypothetical protein